MPQLLEQVSAEGHRFAGSDCRAWRMRSWCRGAQHGTEHDAGTQWCTGGLAAFGHIPEEEWAPFALQSALLHPIYNLPQLSWVGNSHGRARPGDAPRSLAFLAVGGEGAAQDAKETSSLRILTALLSPLLAFPRPPPMLQEKLFVSPRLGRALSWLYLALGTWACLSYRFSSRWELLRNVCQGYKTFPTATVCCSCWEVAPAWELL